MQDIIQDLFHKMIEACRPLLSISGVPDQYVDLDQQ